MNTTRTKGFTIIEVVLVLAIAGLIFLMVFIALPALQRGQRDTGRKNDVSTVAAAVNSYRANSKGAITNLDTTALQGQIDALSEYDKTSATVATGALPAAAFTPTISAITVYKAAKCGTVSGATITVTAGAARGAAIVTALENTGGATQPYCQDV